MGSFEFVEFFNWIKQIFFQLTCLIALSLKNFLSISVITSWLVNYNYLLGSCDKNFNYIWSLITKNEKNFFSLSGMFFKKNFFNECRDIRNFQHTGARFEFIGKATRYVSQSSHTQSSKINKHYSEIFRLTPIRERDPRRKSKIHVAEVELWVSERVEGNEKGIENGVDKIISTVKGYERRVRVDGERDVLKKGLAVMMMNLRASRSSQPLT